MNEKLRISLIQTQIYYKDVERNLRNFERLILNVPNSHIILLPEMFNTSFCPKEKELAEEMTGRTVSWMKKQSKIKNSSIAGTLMIKDDNRIYNRLVWVKQNGEVFYYNKRHLFSLIREDQHLEKGKERLIINDYGWKICPLICYDLRFPIFSRNNVDYDVLIYLSNWPVKRVNAWNVLLKARSIENQCYTIGLNRIGVDENGIEYNGSSQAIDPYGETLPPFKNTEESVINVVCESQTIKKVRKKLNFLKDQDRYFIE